MDHPRIRGERGRCGAYGPIDLGPPPRTRGTHGVASATATISRDHPRVRGERDVAHTSLGAVRGTTPAYAGNAPLVTLKASGRWDHPRVRGERNSPKAIPPEGMGPPPRTRGTRLSMPSFAGRYGTTPRTRGTRPGYGHRRRSGGTTPAYAGNATRTSAQPGDDGDHPRVRGNPFGWTRGRPPYGDHPRVRGERNRSIADEAQRKGPPPRTRGTLGIDEGAQHLFGGPPPRTPGTPPRRVRQRAGGGTTPAYAGNAPSCAACPVSSTDHPRVRGDCSCSRWLSAGIMGPPPRTRGTHARDLPSLWRLGTTPAYAGNASGR